MKTVDIAKLMKPVHCECGRFLAYSTLTNGVVLHKCPKCKLWKLEVAGKKFQSLTTLRAESILDLKDRKAAQG